jgi:hypothetical protein
MLECNIAEAITAGRAARRRPRRAGGARRPRARPAAAHRARAAAAAGGAQLHVPAVSRLLYRRGYMYCGCSTTKAPCTVNIHSQ